MTARAMLAKAHYVLLIPLALYIGLLILATSPAVQRELIYLNRIRLPLVAQYNQPQIYGLAPFKTRTVYLNTSDGKVLGAWHILPQSIYQNHQLEHGYQPIPESTFDEALAIRPTILYFHGNAATRATPLRVRTYSAYSTALDCNVFAIDYRGFGDSTGLPTEKGLLIDAHTAWKYIASKSPTTSALGGNIVVVGHSLGTGVSSALTGLLADEGIHPRALVLIAPFTSLADLLLKFRLFNIIPLLGPLAKFPSLQKYLVSFVKESYPSSTTLSKTTSPVLLLHAVNDVTIPHTESSSLFAGLLHKANGSSVKEEMVEHWGKISTFSRDHAGDVTWWEGLTGGHNSLGWAEGTVDLIRRVAKL